MAYSTVQRSTEQKLAIFRACFNGLSHVYGTYDPETNRAFQVKKPVTDDVILAHLKGQQSYGVYLLVDDRTHALVVDFDHDDPQMVVGFAQKVWDAGLTAYIERSKSKGYHAWLFAVAEGVIARKARNIARQILAGMGQRDVEIFPKQDRLDSKSRYGNFINAPLFGRLVPHGRTVFLDPANGLAPYPDQWEVLSAVRRFSEPELEVIRAVDPGTVPDQAMAEQSAPRQHERSGFGLPPCARRMLQGVESNQRVACFRLGIHLKQLGISQDLATVLLRAWSTKNRPAHGRVIRADEIIAQVAAAYAGNHRSFGCEDSIIAAYCDASCPVRGNRLPTKSRMQRAPDEQT